MYHKFVTKTYNDVEQFAEATKNKPLKYDKKIQCRRSEERRMEERKNAKEEDINKEARAIEGQEGEQ